MTLRERFTSLNVFLYENWWFSLLMIVSIGFIASISWFGNADLQTVLSNYFQHKDIHFSSELQFEEAVSKIRSLAIPYSVVYAISPILKTLVEALVLFIMVYITAEKTPEYGDYFKLCSIAKIPYFFLNMLAIIVMRFDENIAVSLNDYLPLSFGHLLGVHNMGSIAYDITLFYALDTIWVVMILNKVRNFKKRYIVIFLVVFSIVWYLPKLII